MLAATGLAIFLIPALFVLVERIARKDKPKEASKESAPAAGGHGAAPEPQPSGGGH
jgi:hypothetical protein